MGGLPSIGTVIRRNAWLILAPVVLALGAAITLVANLEPTYTASATVLLSPSPGNPLTPETASGSALQMAVAMETEEQMVRTPAVGELASAEANREVPGPGEQLSVSIPSNTQMLDISFSASSAELAREGAESFAEAYLAFRAERAETQQSARLESLRAQVATADAELRRAIAEAAGEGAGAAYASQEVQLLTDRLAQLSNSLSAAELVSTDPGTVINTAREPEDADGLPAWTIVAAAGAVGLFAGLALAILRVWRRDLVKDFDGASSTQLPLFVTVTRVDSADSGGSGATERETHEAFRQLRTAVIANAPDPSVLAISGVGKEGSTGVARHLARVLVEAQFSVVLVRAEPGEPVDGVGGDPGERPSLAEVVLDGVSVEDALVEVDGVRQVALVAGEPGARDVTASPRFREVVAELQQQVDYVILAAGSAGTPEGDAALLASDSTLLVLSSATASRALLEAALQRLEHVGVVPIGMVEVQEARGGAGRQRSR